MKITVLILLATLMHLSASVYAQQTKLSISLKDATVRDVERPHFDHRNQGYF